MDSLPTLGSYFEFTIEFFSIMLLSWARRISSQNRQVTFLLYLSRQKKAEATSESPRGRRLYSNLASWGLQPYRQCCFCVPRAALINQMMRYFRNSWFTLNRRGLVFRPLRSKTSSPPLRRRSRRSRIYTCPSRVYSATRRVSVVYLIRDLTREMQNNI